jgi:hypothetical protein
MTFSTPVELGGAIASFAVYGQPAPQGSKKAMPIYRGSTAKGTREWTGKTALVEQLDARIKSWRTNVVNAAQAIVLCDCGDPHCRAVNTGFPVDEGVIARMVFSMVRPRSHYRSGRLAHLLRDDAPPRPMGKPDVSKLARATEDALKDCGFYVDDARIVGYTRLDKVWCREDPESLEVPGANLSFWRLPQHREVRPRPVVDIEQSALSALFEPDF